ncbi:MAG: YqgE/AlgH family protein [Polyangiaceae bacterium]|nr:YqgE/AlgH family protein [Polyangiaceae bacterium]
MIRSDLRVGTLLQARSGWHTQNVTENLTPGCLVAAPGLACPFFHRAVVLMVEHGAEGSFGFVVNKAADIALDAVAGEMKLGAGPGHLLDMPVMLGGPVSPNTGWVLFDPAGKPLPSEDTVQLGERMAVTSSAQVLERFLSGEAPEHAMVLLGYAGWSPGQLEAEMKEGAWIPVDVDPGLVFETPLGERWESALRALGIDPARMVGQHVASA